MPRLDLVDCQRAVVLDLPLIQGMAPAAWGQVLAAPPGTEPSLLPHVSAVEISILDDAQIARIHGEYLDDPTPTDVITFQHGEILISAETAKREADFRNWPAERELTLYLVHGFLHLHGHDDHEDESRQRMHAIQDAIIDRIWPFG